MGPIDSVGMDTVCGTSILIILILETTLKAVGSRRLSYQCCDVCEDALDQNYDQRL
jgi:hypothetical protein